MLKRPTSALEEKKNILRDKVNATRLSAERVMLTPQEKQAVLKITQEINFAIELAFVRLFYILVFLTHRSLV